MYVNHAGSVFVSHCQCSVTCWQLLAAIAAAAEDSQMCVHEMPGQSSVTVLSHVLPMAVEAVESVCNSIPGVRR